MIDNQDLKYVDLNNNNNGDNDNLSNQNQKVKSEINQNNDEVLSADEIELKDKILK